MLLTATPLASYAGSAALHRCLCFLCNVVDHDSAAEHQSCWLFVEDKVAAAGCSPVYVLPAAYYTADQLCMLQAVAQHLICAAGHFHSMSCMTTVSKR